MSKRGVAHIWTYDNSGHEWLSPLHLTSKIIKIKHTMMLRPLSLRVAGLSRTYCDNVSKTYQFWPDAFRRQGEGKAHREDKISLNSDTESWPIVGSLLLITWPSRLQPWSETPGCTQMKTGSSTMWAGKHCVGRSRNVPKRSVSPQFHPTIASILSRWERGPGDVVQW